jgi:FMN phosphatase YigB (HAD superfamily)
MMESDDDAHAVTTAVPSSPLPPPQQLKISHVILDLDGTLIDTETLVEEALELIVSGYGKKWDGKGAHKRLGRRPLESAASLIQDYDLPCTPQELHSQILAFMKNRHANSSDASFFFFYSQLFFALLPQNHCLFVLFNRVFPSRYHLLE